MNHQFRLQVLYTSIRQILATFREYAMINTMNDVNQANHADHTNPMTQIDHLFDEKGAFTPKCYINRDLSALRFQLRVLAQAANPNHPLLERMFFLTIFPQI